MRKLAKKISVGLASAGAFLASATPVLARSDFYDYYTTPADTAAATGVLGLFSLIWCCVPLIVLIVSAALAYYVYKDAQKHKIENAGMWAVVVFVFNIFGLLVYMLIIKPEALKGKGGHKEEEKSKE